MVEAGSPVLPLCVPGWQPAQEHEEGARHSVQLAEFRAGGACAVERERVCVQCASCVRAVASCELRVRAQNRPLNVL